MESGDGLSARAQHVARVGRWLLVPTLVLVLALATASAWQSWDARRSDDDEKALQVQVQARNTAAAVDQFFGDRITTLETVARTPAVLFLDFDRLPVTLAAVSNRDLRFSGGVGWVDRAGLLRVSAGVPSDQLPIDLSGRDYVREVFRTEAPVISEAIPGRLTGTDLVALAVPTFDPAGALTGLLVASIPLDELGEAIPALDPAGADVTVVEQDDDVILTQGSPGLLEPPANAAVADEARDGAVFGEGLFGQSGRIVAAAGADRTGWTLVVEDGDPTSLASFLGEIAVVFVLTALVFAGALVAARLLDVAQRQATRRARDLTSLEELSEELATAMSPEAVAEKAQIVLSRVFDAEATAVFLADAEPERLVCFSELAGATDGEIGPPLIQIDSAALEAEVFRTGRTMVQSADELRRRDPAHAARFIRADGAMAARFRAVNAAGIATVSLRGRFPPRSSTVALFEALVRLLGDAFGRTVAVRAERAALHTFQGALMPRDEIEREIPVQRCTRYLPAYEVTDVGGDWYDLFAVSETEIGMVVGDVVGSGVHAAAVMGQLRSSLRATAVLTRSPGKALDRLEELARPVDGTLCTTVVLAMLDVRAGVLRVASAGHPPPFIAGADGVRIVTGTAGTPLGAAIEPVPRREVTTTLGPEETLILYTDGLIERRGEVIDVGLERLATALGRARHLPIERLADALVDACVPVQRDDDVALVCVRPVREPARTFSFAFPARPDELANLRRLLRHWLELHHAEPVSIETTLLTVGEAAGNAIEHGYRGRQDGTVVVEVLPRPGELEITVTDAGRWLPPVPDPARGRGRKIIEQLACDFSIDGTAEGTRVRFVVPLEERLPAPV